MARDQDAQTGSATSEEDAALARVEQLIDMILEDRENARSTFFDFRIKDLRKALDQATKDHAWDVLDRTFSMISATTTEMMLRAVIALRMACDQHDERHGSRQYPPVAEHAERLQRVAVFTLDCATRYAKVRHVSSITPPGDPKIVQFAEATKRVHTSKSKQLAAAKARAKAVEA